MSLIRTRSHETAPLDMCESAEELHALCGFLIGQDKNKHCAILNHNARAAVGWELLFKAYLGGRNQETEAYRMDAKKNQPGYFDWAMKQMYHSRSKGARILGCKLEPWDGCKAVYELIAAHRAWHRATYSDRSQYGAKVPWFFPNKYGERIDKESSHASDEMIAACRSLGIPRRTQHGMRAFHVHVLRSQGELDQEIANRLGHSDTKQVEQTYDACRSGFRGAKTVSLEPKDRSKLAYAQWLPKSQAHSEAHFLSQSG